jgi:hypothetical protein
LSGSEDQAATEVVVVEVLVALLGTLLEAVW